MKVAALPIGASTPPRLRYAVLFVHSSDLITVVAGEVAFGVAVAVNHLIVSCAVSGVIVSPKRAVGLPVGAADDVVEGSLQLRLLLAVGRRIIIGEIH